jgi:hypothetical protein
LDPKERFSQIEKKSWNQDWRFSWNSKLEPDSIGISYVWKT